MAAAFRNEDYYGGLDGSVDKKGQVDALLKERIVFLKEIVGRAFASADKNPQPFPAAAYANIFDPRQGPDALNKIPVLKPIEQEARDKITVPTAIVLSEDEAYFKHQDFVNSEKDQQITGQGRMFNNATEYVVKILGWSHNATLVEPERFGKMMGSLIERMRRDKKQAGPSLGAQINLTI